MSQDQPRVWHCTCGAVNFESKIRCRKCRKVRPEGVVFVPKSVVKKSRSKLVGYLVGAIAAIITLIILMNLFPDNPGSHFSLSKFGAIVVFYTVSSYVNHAK